MKPEKRLLFHRVFITQAHVAINLVAAASAWICFILCTNIDPTVLTFVCIVSQRMRGQIGDDILNDFLGSLLHLLGVIDASSQVLFHYKVIIVWTILHQMPLGIQLFDPKS